MFLRSDDVYGARRLFTVSGLVKEYVLGARALTHGEMVLLSVLVLQARVTKQLSASRLLTLSSFPRCIFRVSSGFLRGQ